MNLARTDFVDASTGFEPACYRFAGGSLASRPRREKYDEGWLLGLEPRNRRITTFGLIRLAIATPHHTELVPSVGFEPTLAGF